MDLRGGQGDARERLAYVPELRGRGPQELPPHRRVEEQVVDLDGRAHRTAAGRRLAQTPPAASISAPLWLSGVRLRSTSRLTSAIEARASPRKPRVPTRNRSSASASLLVACGPGPAAVRRPECRRRCPPPGPSPARPVQRKRRSARPGVHRVFHQLLDHAGGRSITSPAAILLIRLGGRRWMGMGQRLVPTLCVGTGNGRRSASASALDPFTDVERRKTAVPTRSVEPGYAIDSLANIVCRRRDRRKRSPPADPIVRRCGRDTSGHWPATDRDASRR